MNWHEKEILITGGTGSLSKALIQLLNEGYQPKGIRIFSRDELKQWQLKQDLHGYTTPIAFLIGDVRDYDRVKLATKGVNIIIHTAALKQVPSCEDNPLEAIQTNVLGARNILKASLENKVEKVMNISTDKAVMPINLYGASKMCAEKLFINGNVYSGGRYPYFSCCRYGNVVGSRGSVIPLFKKQAQEGLMTITHEDMTRFWITLKQVAQFIIDRITNMKGGEIFVPKMPSVGIMDLARIIYFDYLNKDLSDKYIEVPYKIIGIRPGEKLHEVLITEEENRNMIDVGKYFILNQNVERPIQKAYTSINNDWWLLEEEIKEMI